MDFRLAAAGLVAGTLLAVAALHIGWARGSRWPGRDEESLARMVVGGPPGLRMPNKSACLVVAVLLITASFLLLGQQGVLTLPLPRWLVRLGAGSVTVVLGARGLVGFFDRYLRPETLGSPFVKLNLWFYSPLCVALAGLSIFSLWE